MEKNQKMNIYIYIYIYIYKTKYLYTTESFSCIPETLQINYISILKILKSLNSKPWKNKLCFF